MATIIDKRKAGKNKSVDNRRRFVDRYKDHIEESLDRETTIADGSNKKKISISKKNVKEPTFELDRRTGKGQRVLPGNDTFKPGDKIYKPDGSSEQGNGGSDTGEGEDDFNFVLTKQEFIDIYFKDMELPDFVKKSLKDNTETRMVRCGYSKEGIPPRLDLLKTFKQAIGRRIASGSETFLEELDMRYRRFEPKPFPIKKARIFFLMDVSGSMGEYEKLLAKKFFLLFYLFLEQSYDKVDITFIRHTTEAYVCSEQEFFYSRDTGGTIVSTGLALINKIIDEQVNLSQTNIYVAQASDGDNWLNDSGETIEEMVLLLDKVQYFAYIQTEHPERVAWKRESGVDDLFDLYEVIQRNSMNKKLNIKHVFQATEVYPVLKQLFGKE